MGNVLAWRLIPPIVDGNTTIHRQGDKVAVAFYCVVPFVALAAAALFTKWYPDESAAAPGPRLRGSPTEPRAPVEIGAPRLSQG